MNVHTPNRVIQSIKKARRQAGFTVLEAMVTVVVITVVSGVVIPAVYNEFEKAKVQSCKAELNGMKAVALALGDGRYIPTPDEFWGEGYPNAAEGEYYYIVDSQDHNKGHGNDLDGCDEDNPGNSPRCPGMDVKFVVFCAHDHGSHAAYCYATDVDPPTVVLPGEEDPFNFKAQKDKDQGEQGPPEGKKPKKGGKKK